MMIRAVGKKSGDWFAPQELLNFPCTDLRTIDGMWVNYSQGKFGFSVQKKIYVECGAKLDGNSPGATIWPEFSDRIGWRKGDSYQLYEDLKANPSFSPTGEFPNFGWHLSGKDVPLSVKMRVANMRFKLCRYFLVRIKTCEL